MSSIQKQSDRSEYLRNYYVANREKIIKKSRKYAMLRKYGMTQEDADKMLADQGGVCAICHADNPQRKNSDWSIDHCHTTGRVRGILCTPCNTMLGNARDNKQTLANAIQYLN